MTHVEVADDLCPAASRNDKTPLAEQTVRASLWTTGGRFFTKGLDFIALLILARYLGPEEFGLVAMAMTAVLIVETVSEVPLAAALLNHRQPTARMYDTALTISVLRALAIIGVLCVTAWPLSLLYHEPRLVALQCILSLAPAMRGCLSQKLTEYARIMDFRREVALEVAAKVGSLVIATLVAIITGSYWAIAIGKISSTAIAMLASYFLAPQRLRFTLGDWHLFADMLGWNSARQLLSAVSWQADKVILPRYVDIGTFGAFTWADNLIAVPAQSIIQPITRPLYSAFVIARQKGNLCEVYLKSSAGIYATIAPLFLLMGILASPIIHLILGPAWNQTGPILTWLAFAAAVGYAPTVLLPALAMSLNRTRIAFEKLAIELCLKVPLIVILTMLMTLQGMLIGHAIAAFAGLVTNLVLVRKLARISILTQLASLLRPTVAMIPMAMFLFASASIFDPNEAVLRTFCNLCWVSASAIAIFITTNLLLWKLAGTPVAYEQILVRIATRVLGR